MVSSRPLAVTCTRTRFDLKFLRVFLKKENPLFTQKGPNTLEWLSVILVSMVKIDKLNCCVKSIVSIFHDFNDLQQ